MKKFIMIFNEENYYVPQIIERFLQNNPGAIEKIYTVPFFPPQAKKGQYLLASGLSSGPLFMIKYFLKTLLQSLTPKLAKKLGMPLIDQVCKDFGMPMEHIENVNSDTFINQLKQDPGIVVLSMTSQLYRERVLNESGAKFYNFHPGLLPRNKGRFPIFWAFYNHDGVQGVTCHEINQKIDDGRTLFQKEIPQELGDDMESILDKLAVLAPKAFEEAIERINRNDYQKDLNPAESFYGPTPTLVQVARYNLLILKRKLRAIFYRPAVKQRVKKVNQ